MGHYLVVLPPPNLPGIQPVPHKLDTWLLLLKTRGLNCTSDCSVCIWQLSGSVWYFYSQCRAEQMSPVGTLCSSQLSHWAEGAAAAAAAPARSACVLSYLGRRPHTWAGVALSLSWWIGWEFSGCWDWFVHGQVTVEAAWGSWSQLLQTSPIASVWDSDGLLHSKLFQLWLCVFNCGCLYENKDFLDWTPRMKRRGKILKTRTHLFLSETSECVWGCIFFRLLDADSVGSFLSVGMTGLILWFKEVGQT